MHVPSVERRVSEARPWGLAPGEQSGVRLEPVYAPLAGIVLRGTLMVLLTLGLYRFWYRTALRRYYWQNTRLLDDGFEYTGTGRELFIGFLIAIAVILPLNIAATIATLALGPNTGEAVGFAIFFLVIPALVQIAVYRARRYRLSRTRYRGIRFSQTGSGTAYLLTSLKWILLVVVTLGIAFPQMRTALYRYRTENTYFGNVPASFDGDVKPLMKRWLAVWACFALVVALVVMRAIAVGAGVGFSDEVIFEVLLGAAALAATPVLWQVYKVAEFRHFTGHTAFGELRLASDVAARSVIWVVAKFVLLLIAALCAAGLLVGASAAAIGGMHVASGADSTGLAALVYLAMFVAIPVSYLVYSLLTELYLRHRLWVLFAGSVSIANTSALKTILQQEGGPGAGAFGEAFDGGFEIAG